MPRTGALLLDFSFRTMCFRTDCVRNLEKVLTDVENNFTGDVMLTIAPLDGSFGPLHNC